MANSQILSPDLLSQRCSLIESANTLNPDACFQETGFSGDMTSTFLTKYSSLPWDYPYSAPTLPMEPQLRQRKHHYSDYGCHTAKTVHTEQQTIAARSRAVSAPQSSRRPTSAPQSVRSPIPSPNYGKCFYLRSPRSTSPISAPQSLRPASAPVLTAEEGRAATRLLLLSFDAPCDSRRTCGPARIAVPRLRSAPKARKPAQPTDKWIERHHLSRTQNGKNEKEHKSQRSYFTAPLLLSDEKGHVGTRSKAMLGRLDYGVEFQQGDCAQTLASPLLSTDAPPPAWYMLGRHYPGGSKLNRDGIVQSWNDRW